MTTKNYIKVRMIINKLHKNLIIIKLKIHFHIIIKFIKLYIKINA
jgi:hypothetical protein